MTHISFKLPWPPSANTYWRRNGERYFISSTGQAYRKHVASACYELAKSFMAEDRIRISIQAYPPDRRRRDLDNICKALLDSLQAATIFPDDSQIDELNLKRMSSISGHVYIEMESIPLCT